MLWFLHLCAAAGVVVIDYSDHSTGIMQETINSGVFFKEITLHPEVTVKDEPVIDKANSLHRKTDELCFVANSVKFSIYHKPVCKSITAVVTG